MEITTKSIKIISLILLILTLLIFLQINNFKLNAAEISGTFIYGNHSHSFFYNDDYFTEASFNYNPSLATLSMFTVWAGYDCVSESYEYRYKDIETMYKDMKFENFEVNESYRIVPTVNTIGAAIATRTITDNGKDYTLIAVTLHLGTYESEWANNFIYGKEGSATGFSNAKNTVLGFINEYIDKYNIEGDIKLWLSGFSRTANISNLLGGELNEGNAILKNVNLEKEDMYVYVMGTSYAVDASKLSNGENETIHLNIHNILSKDDFVSKIIPAELGLGMYGVIHWIPNITYDTNFIEKFNVMKEIHNVSSSRSKNIDSFHNYIIPKILNFDGFLNGEELIIPGTMLVPYGQYLDDAVQRFTNEVLVTRLEYVNKVQNIFSIYFTSMYGTTFDNINYTTMTQFSKLVAERLFLPENIIKLIFSQIPVINGLVGYDYEVINSIVTESLNEVGINNLTLTEIRNIVESVLDLAIKALLSCPDYVITILPDYNTIVNEHHNADIFIAWSKSCDPNYNKNNIIEFSTTPNYRAIRIIGDVDIVVYDGNDKIAEMIDETVDINFNKVAISINYEGHKLIYLPVTKEYNIEITAKTDGNVSYEINEYSFAALNYTRFINFKNVFMTDGTTMTGVASKFIDSEIEDKLLNGSTALYTLEYNSDQFNYISDLRGNKASDKYKKEYLDSGNALQAYILGRSVRMATYYTTEEIKSAFNDFLNSNNTVQEQSENKMTIPMIDYTSMVHNVNFQVNGGSSVKQHQVTNGNLLSEPENPTKRNKEFDGWYTDQELTIKYDFNSPVLYSFKLYAKWK